MAPLAPAERVDALLIVSFGGPEGPHDVLPFLENVTRGRGVPPERLAEVAGHYSRFGGLSPLNGQNLALAETLRAELARHGIELPVYLGNRNWHPFLADTLRVMRDDGVGRALGFLTSAYSSYSGCRQYLENIAEARVAVGDAAPWVSRLRFFHNHPGFIAACTDRVEEALRQLPFDRRTCPLVFTAHSIPAAMAVACDYEAQLTETARLVAGAVGASEHAVVYQSRSGPPHVPWLEPDVSDHLRWLATTGATHAVIAPIGFLSDHLEVLYDLDVEAQAAAAEAGLTVARAATVGTHPAFVSMIRELVQERIVPGTPRRSLGRQPVPHDTCAPGCCASGR